MYESGKFSEMLNYCSKLLEKNPNDLMALQNSALSLLNLENYSEAITYCDRVLKENNFDMNRFHKESFEANSGPRNSAKKNILRDLKIDFLKNERQLKADGSSSLLDLATSEGIALNSGCRSGSYT